MAITDELRAWAHGPDEGDDWLDRIDEFCNRIDAAYERGGGFEGMSITDELREYANIATDRDIYAGARLCKIADRIDERHERALRESYDCGYASADDWLAQHEDAMAEHGWVRLPLDADGVPIRVGDRLTDGEYTFTVCELATFRDGSWSIRNEDGNAWAACDVTHHALTVEDVLDEFFGKANLPDGTQTRAEIVAEYAAKLRLAEEVDE